jgi:DNA-binding NtrC family response regulator
MIGRKDQLEEAHRSQSTVLLVEDEQVSRRALTALLNRSGYQTTAVGSAEEAIVELSSNPLPKVALIDLDLPGMSGTELLTILAKIDRDVVPIVISAADDERLFAAIRLTGAAFLRKPLNFEHLLSVLSDAKVLH